MATVDRLDGARTSKAIKAPVAAASTADLTLSAAQTVDGVALVADDRILVKDQSTGSENGIYVVANGAWSRARDFNKDNDISDGTMVLVNAGTVNSNLIYALDTASPVIGTSSLTFSVNQGVTSAFGATLVAAANAAAARALLGTEVAEDLSPQLGAALDTNAFAVQWSKGADVASATELLVLLDGNCFDVTGTTTIATIEDTADAWKVGSVIVLQFDGILTLTHHATDLILPGGRDITTAAGDVVTFQKIAAGDWRLISSNGVGRGKTFILSQDASSDTELDFTGFNAAAFDSYEFEISGLRLIDGENLNILTSTDGGSTFDTGASDYSWVYSVNSIGTLSSSTDVTSEKIDLIAFHSTTGVPLISGTVKVLNADDANYTQITWDLTINDTGSAAALARYIGSGARLSAADVDAIRFIPTTGADLVSGRISMYGNGNS